MAAKRHGQRIGNGRPEITETGARYRAAGNGPGYAPPSQTDGEFRFGCYQTTEIVDPFIAQDLDADEGMED